MPTAPAPPPSATGQPAASSARGASRPVPASAVDQRVRRAARSLAANEIATAIATLVIGGLLFLAVAALLEHWVTTSGLRHSERWALWSVGLIGAAAYALRRIAPLLVRRINPLYAASQIEREAPTLKNALVNLLQLRSPGAVGRQVQQTLEQQAAERLAAAGETPLDRSRLVRRSYMLLALLAIAAIYTVISPKNLFVSAYRIAAPWARVSAPTRVSIAGIEPGDAQLNQGQSIEISARVLGTASDEPVELIYTTADGRLRNARLAMRTTEDNLTRYRLSLPADVGTEAALGLQSNITYRIEAGDARSETYRLTVQAAPTIAPTSVSYDYPDYTGYADRLSEGSGDLRAIEGTRVTLFVRANLPIESAQVDRGADGTPDVLMKKIEGVNATAEWTLARTAEASGSAPEVSSYVLRFSTPDGQANADPPRYQIETLADLAPEVRLIAPADETLTVGLDDPIDFAIEALDPDFALCAVKIVGEVEGRQRVDEALFFARGDVAQHEGPLERTMRRTPRELGLRPGEQLRYAAVAVDNRTPQPQSAVSEKRTIVVRSASSDAPQGNQGQQGSEGQQGETSQPGQQEQPGQEGQAAGSQEGGGQAAGGEQQNQARESGQATGSQPPPAGAPNQPQKDSTADEQASPADGADQPQDPAKPQQQEQRQQQDGEQQSGSQEGESSVSQQEPKDQQQGPGGTDRPGGLQAPSQSDQQGQQENSAQGGSGAEGTNNSESGSDSAGGDRPSNQQGTGNGERRPGSPQGGETEPVDPNGANDAEAFDRIRQHLDEKTGESRGRKPSGQESADDDAQPQSEGSGEGSGKNNANADQPGGANQGANPREARGETPEREPSDPVPQEGAKGERSDSATGESGQQAPPGQNSKPNAGPREGTGDAGQNQAADEGGGQAGDQGLGESSGEQGRQELAERPTGESSGNQRGAGSESHPGEQRSDNAEEPGAGGDGTAADRPQDGTNGARAGDTENPRGGRPAAGDRERSDDDASANNNTDQPDNAQRSGEQPGRGSAGKEAGQSGAEGERDPPNGGEPSSGDPSEDANQRWSDEPQQGSNSESEARGGNEPSQPDRTTNRNGTPDAPGDAANLDYARRQTELTLERLSDQLARGKADRELLDKLGWSEEDLQRLVQRWRTRLDRAERNEQGASELDAALRSLGIGERGPTGKSTLTDDELRDLRDAPRAPAPPALLERLRSYNRGVNAAGER
ncbi:hypothetical protein [Botrimarina hoheduenensis]|uniref:Uncharacterized protein n=1 Tax=Botrimarina hoheduenensis TaxID=2528000 RepID=A0A5C5VXM3_9BACT|nr:hypothetical protein [Botrimarina hoheduenensis]TWT42461.1 hypothetical protein Pla111_27660 [Botrimarina hoheduenensis]